MANTDTTVVLASEKDIATLAAVRPGYGTKQVADRFRWLREEIDGTWILCKAKDAVIGWYVAVWSGKETHPEYPDMQDLFVKEDSRNQGHGTLLIFEFEHRARDRGHDKVGLAVNPEDNQPARRLYERLGYRHDGGSRYLDGVYGEYEDWVIDLEKQLL